MPKLKFFLIAISSIILLFLGEHLLKPADKRFAAQKKGVSVTTVTNKEEQINDIAMASIAPHTNAEIFTWKMLNEISYKERKTKDFPESIMYPVINPKLKTKKGKRIRITGYIIPVDEKTFAISKNVMSACFFCGMAGPETIMGIKFKGNTPRLKTDQHLTLTGTFNYNETNPDDWIYHIENATIAKN